MSEHPEQHLINIIISGDIAGVDEENWEEWSAANKALSADGRKELERQKKQVNIEIAEQEKRSEFQLYLMSPDATKH